MLLLDLPHELLELVLDATDTPAGLRLASKRFASMPRGKAKIRMLQHRALRLFGAVHCYSEESWMETTDALIALSWYLGLPLYVLRSSSRPAAQSTPPSSLRFASVVYTLAEADKMRDHLVAQRPLLQRELTEHCRSWYLEIGHTLPRGVGGAAGYARTEEAWPLDQIREYLEHKMKVPAGTLDVFRTTGYARKWLCQRVDRAEAAIRSDMDL